MRKSRRRHSRRQGMRMAVGSVKMQPPCESPALAAVAAVAAADGALRRSPSARDPEREHLGEVSSEQFRLSLLKSVAETSNWILPFAGEVWKERIVDHLMSFTRDLTAQFPPRAFFANLHGDIRAALGQKNI